ncbi:hypothetical protein [Planococcus glaciei]|uniref:hypothetical protein n=1 Tax=Planococcus glaciei TaxID=459472 RepID=UPI001C73CCDB|nr:hypothetical protein [Planococcus glaciei]MBX0314665.1 hypothetical protein [Planococcus glaciei]
MKTLINNIDVTSVNGQYRFYQYNDGNPLPQIELFKIENNKEVMMKNVLGEVKKLNEEFLFKIDFHPKNRKHPLNTREFSDKFIKSYQEI